MKTVIRGVDDLVYRLQIERADGTEFLLSDFDSFEVAVFTTDAATCYIVESEFIDADDNLVRIPADRLLLNNSAVRAYLQDGIIRLQVLTSIVDDKFPDGENTESNIVATNYFLKTISD